jgi:hypothetical protein
MAIRTVRKDGSGTYTTIQSAIAAASPGDTIDIGPGTYLENVDVYKPLLSFMGAGMTQTIVRGTSNNAYTRTATFTSGSPVIACTNTSGMEVGQPVEGNLTQLPVACYIVSIDPNVSVTVNQNANSSGSGSLLKRVNEGTIVTRAANLTFQNMRIEGFDAHDGAEKAAMYFRNINTGWKSANGGLMAPSFNIAVDNCEIVADGEYAILSEAISTVGSISITFCKISGKTFSGANPVAGGVRQAVVIQPQNTGINQFFNNVVDVVCGGVTTAGATSANQAVSIDASGSIVTDNKIRARSQDASGNYINLPGLALRMRGIGNTVSGNVNKCYGGLTNYGYLLTPSWSNLSGKSMSVGQIVWISSKFYKCVQAHTVVSAPAASSNSPEAAGGASLWQNITAEADLASQLEAQGYGYYVQNVNSNITATAPLVDPVQPTSEDQLEVSFQKSQLLLHPSVSGTDFGDEANWYLVSCIYKKVGSSQRIIASFKSFSGSKKPKIKSGMGSGDQFELHKIIISKEDKTMVVLKRNQIDEASDSDFTLK